MARICNKRPYRDPFSEISCLLEYGHETLCVMGDSKATERWGKEDDTVTFTKSYLSDMSDYTFPTYWEA